MLLELFSYPAKTWFKDHVLARYKFLYSAKTSFIEAVLADYDSRFSG
jgi:hypothetical protein